MKMTGMSLALIGCKPEAMAEYNRWYDTDHVVEWSALPGIIMGRRYVATPDCLELRGPTDIEGLEGDAGNMCTTYLQYDEPDDAQEARSALMEQLGKDGRLFKGPREIRWNNSFRLRSAYTRKGYALSPQAVPYAGHKGIFVAIGEVLDEGRRAEWERFYDEVHIPDILECKGFAGGLWLSGVARPGADDGMEKRFLLVFLLDEDPAEAVADFRRRRPIWQEQGRLMEPGAYKLLFSGPFRSIVPFQYSFVKEFQKS